MKKLRFKLVAIFTILTTTIGYTQNIAERLGYPRDAKLLIIHADDVGVTHSENMASIKGLESSPVNSAGIMVPCPWFLEIADYAKSHNTLDFGLHLTLNSEWKYYKWGPVTSLDSVSSLVNDNGYFFDNIPEVIQKAKPDEVQLELENQVKMALRNQINVTHLDPHMGTAVASKPFLEKYIEVGNKFQLPVLLEKDEKLVAAQVSDLMKKGNQVFVDKIYTAYPLDFKNGMSTYYTNILNNLEPGLNTLLIHLAFDDKETQAVTVGKVDWGATWRQSDFDFFTSDACKSLIDENDITLVTWREIRDKIIRAKN